MSFMHALQSLDEQLFVLINQKLSAGYLDGIMSLASHHYFWIPVYALLVWWMWKHYQHRIWLPLLSILLVFGFSDSFSSRVLKPGIARERPFLNEKLHARLPDGPAGSKYGFVSSHAANTFGIYTFAALALGFKRRKWIVFLGIAALVSYSRVYLGVHYPGDVLFGALLGIVSAFLVYKVMRRLEARLST
jgi:undecaprenyl-diphosphatase